VILQALHALADAENLVGDPDYEWKPVPWLVRVDAAGRLLGIQDTRTWPPVKEGSRRRPKPVAKTFLVPRQEKRAYAIVPYLLCDKAAYVFGVDPSKPDTPPRTGRTGKCFEAFKALVEACHADTGDEGVTAVLTLLNAVAEGTQPVDLPDDYGGSDLMAFVYDPDVDRLVSDRPAVRQWWKARRAADAGEPTHRCLVTGAACTPIDKHPGIKRMPGGARSGVALVGFNKSAFWSYGWRRNENAPVSREAAEACATALNRLLDPRPQNADGEALPVRHVRLPGDTVVCFWAPEAEEQGFLDALPSLVAADPEQVANLYHALWRGRMPDIDDASAFYAMTLSGAQGRATLRDWIQSTVSEVAEHLAQHFADLAIVRNTPKPRKGDLPPAVPLRTLLQSLAPRGKDDAVPAPLEAQLVRAVLTGTPYPLGLLQRVLERARAEVGADDWPALARRDARAALVKAVLNRRRRFQQGTLNTEVTEAMDPANTNPGYLLGQMLAVLERLQQEAINDVNASVVDRYFGAASATPKAVFVRLLRNARHHARKLRDDRQKAGLAFRLERLLDETAAHFGVDTESRTYPMKNAFPAYLDLEEQGLFILGYHHMRKWLWMNAEERTAWEEAHPHAPRAYHWKRSETAAEAPAEA